MTPIHIDYKAVHHQRLAALIPAQGVDQQWTTPQQPFPHPLAVYAHDEYGRGIPGVQVTFMLINRRNVHFSNHANQVTAYTDIDGKTTVAQMLMAGRSPHAFTVDVSATLENVTQHLTLRLYVDPEEHTTIEGAKTGSLQHEPQVSISTTQVGQAFPIAELGQFVAKVNGHDPVKGLPVTLTLYLDDGIQRQETDQLRFIVKGQPLASPSLIRVTNEKGVVYVPPIESVGLVGHYDVNASAPNLYNPNELAYADLHLIVEATKR